MPYRSRAQQRAFHAKAERGEIDEKTVEEWDRASEGKKLPERAPGSDLGKWAKKKKRGK